MNFEGFCGQFRFQQKWRLHLGLEAEWFLCDPKTQMPVPRAQDFLGPMSPDWTKELSACQVEFRTPPCASPQALVTEFKRGRAEGAKRAAETHLLLGDMALAPFSMPLDVYPDERYQAIARRLSIEVLRSACRVAGIHIHVGVANLSEAVTVYNQLVRELPHLRQLINTSQGERLRTYSDMARSVTPPLYDSVENFFAQAKRLGFAADLRSCYDLIRISGYGTVEVRVFDTTSDHLLVQRAAETVQDISRQALGA